jgi:hypothetical protein
MGYSFSFLFDIIKNNFNLFEGNKNIDFSNVANEEEECNFNPNDEKTNEDIKFIDSSISKNNKKRKKRRRKKISRRKKKKRKKLKLKKKKKKSKLKKIKAKSKKMKETKNEPRINQVLST